MRIRAAATLGALLLAVSLAAQDAVHLGKTLKQWQADLTSAERLDRLLAARAVGEMAAADRRGAAKALFEAMDHEDSAVRYWAAVAVGQMGGRGKPAAKSLRRALRDEAPEVRAWAAFALANLGGLEEALPVLRDLLSHPNRGARLQAAHVLDALGPQAAEAADALKQALDDDFDYVQRVARHALWTLGERPCPYRQCD